VVKVVIFYTASAKWEEGFYYGVVDSVRGPAFDSWACELVSDRWLTSLSTSPLDIQRCDCSCRSVPVCLPDSLQLHHLCKLRDAR
jgi:hypothetical protein